MLCEGSYTIDIVVRSGDALQDPSDLAAVFGFVDEGLPDAVAGLIEGADFTGKANQTALVYPNGAVAAKRVLEGLLLGDYRYLLH